MFFSDCGKLVRVTIPKNVFNQSPLGHACLEFDTTNAALEAMLKMVQSLWVRKSELHPSEATSAELHIGPEEERNNQEERERTVTKPEVTME